MDIALAVEQIIPAAAYFGSVTANTPEAWEAARWHDERRDKPSWEELEAVWLDAHIKNVAKEYEARVQERLDKFARTLTYYSILSACTYATSVIEMYRIEGQYCVEARDATWARAYSLMESIVPQVQAGAEIPSWEDIEVQLPPLVWPEGSRGYIVPENTNA